MPVSRTPRFFQLHQPDSDGLRSEAIAGLEANPAYSSPKFFYDLLGSHLFEAITVLPEYYPTRTEQAILDANAAEMARLIGQGSTLIDLGAGNCAKASRLMPALKPSRYVAVDISVDFLRDALARVQLAHPELDVIGVGLDFSTSLELPALEEPPGGAERPVFFYPGSSLGNFTPVMAFEFLQRVRRQASGGGLLLGIDLVKDRRELVNAYDDALGVTAAFNLNVLRCLNRLIGSDFDPRQWQHVALFNEAEARVEMHLQAKERLSVRWPGGERRFEANERLHTENACKWTLEGFAGLLERAGFRAPMAWSDAGRRFAVFWAPA